MGLPLVEIAAEAAYVGSWATALPEVLKAILLPLPDILARHGTLSRLSWLMLPWLNSMLASMPYPHLCLLKAPSR